MLFPKLSPRLQSAIVARLGWSSLRPVQDQAGEVLLAGQNAIVLAPTAGGKTEAALFPVLSQLLEEPGEGVRALYIAPIKALLNNQSERLGLYTEMVGLRRFVWHGDITTQERRSFLKEPAELLMTTPESLEVMLVSQKVNTQKLFTDLRFVVVDEIHALAGTDRGAHLLSVLERLVGCSQHDVQRIGLSATVGNPAEILSWIQGSSRRGGAVVDPAKVVARRSLLVQHRPALEALTVDAATLAKGQKSLLFCQSRATTEAVAQQMRRAGTAVFVHHSAVSKEERALAEENFARGQNACIVCTSTLELGIDVGDLDRVLQMDAPDTVSSFLQRMGRTGRRSGQVANTTFLCESSESVLQAIALIELARSGWVESVRVDGRCWPVLVHQLLAMSLAENGVTLEDAWTQLQKVPDFRRIHRAEFDRLIAWMLRDKSLLLSGGRLLLGPKAEQKFGRRNFMELYAVFSSPTTYRVETMPGQPLGTLSQDFVDRLVDGISCFLLGGRAWVVQQIRHSDRVVRVEPAPRGVQPTWGGFLPQFLGRELCTQIRTILCSDSDYSWLSPEARKVLAEKREQFGDVLEGDRIEGQEGVLNWWTFAGGRINSTLRYALKALGGDWKVVPDNWGIRIEGEHLRRADLLEVIGRLKEPEVWEDQNLWKSVAADLPGYRLSKFQVLLPPWVEREMLAAFLMDIGGAYEWLAGSPSPSGSHSSASPSGSRSSELPSDRQSPSSTSDIDQPPQTPKTHPLPPGEVAQRVAEGFPSADRSPVSPTVASPVPSPVHHLTTGPLGTPVEWVDLYVGLERACAALAEEPVIALDVETTLYSRTLCLIQMAGRAKVYLIDALEMPDLEPLAALLANPSVKKVIHNATFEKGVLGVHQIKIEPVVDTLTWSRKLRGKIDGGHSLKAVSARELQMEMDKGEQTSDWSRRPLSLSQQKYAALDAEILLRLYDHFGREDRGLFGGSSFGQEC